MLTSFYTASTGTIQIQKGMDVVANNIANVSTTGFKPSETNFSDLVYTAMQGTGQNMKLGHGAKLAKTDVVFSNGGINQTGRNLDFAVFDRTGFFGIITPEGMKYTKNGNFFLSEGEDGAFYLASELGGFVADAQGNPIAINPDTLETQTLAVGVFTFENLDGLMRDGDSAFLATPNSGNAVAVPDAEVQQGFLEGSAVDMAQEMSSVIQLQRAFQLNTRIVQMADEVMQTVNSMR